MRVSRATLRAQSRTADQTDRVRCRARDRPRVAESRGRHRLWVAAFKVDGRMFACLASHRSAEPNTLVVRMDFDERDGLIAAEPKTYYLTDHYVDYPCVLVRLTRVRHDALRDLLLMGWRFVSAAKSRSGCEAETPVTARQVASARPSFLMVFTKRLREGVRRGRIQMQRSCLDAASRQSGRSVSHGRWSDCRGLHHADSPARHHARPGAGIRLSQREGFARHCQTRPWQQGLPHPVSLPPARRVGCPSH